MKIETEIRSGSFYVFIFRYSGVLIQLVIGAVLARLLTPEEFGVVAVVVVFINFFQLLAESGLSAAVIQRKDFSYNEFYSLFLITIGIGLLLGSLFYVAGFLIADFYENNVYQNIAHLLAISLFFNALNTIPSAMIFREKKFKEIGIRDICVKIASGILSIILAFKGFSFYSIIYGNILSAILIFILNLHLSKLKISRKINFRVLNSVFKYSFFQFMFNVVNYFSRNLDNLLIGKYLGPVALGYYDKAYKLMLFPISNLSRVVTPVLHPVFSSYQNDTDLIYGVYKKIIKFLAIIGFPASIFLYFSANEIVFLLYGSQWGASVGAFKFLALTVGIQIVLVSSGSIFQALGRTDYLFQAGLFSSFVSVTAILIGVFIGKSFVAVAFLLIFAFSINFIQGFYLLIIKAFRKNWGDFLKLFSPGIIIAAIFIGLGIIIEFFFSTGSLILSLLIKMSSFLILYIVMLLFLNELKFLINIIKPKKNNH